jgi:hypothetical protein
MKQAAILSYFLPRAALLPGTRGIFSRCGLPPGYSPHPQSVPGF